MKWRIGVPLAVALAAMLGQLGLLPPAVVQAVHVVAQAVAPEAV